MAIVARATCPGDPLVGRDEPYALGFLCRGDEALHERQCLIGDLAPAMVDDERVAAIRYLDDLGHALVLLLLLVGGVCDRWGDRMVFPAGNDQERSAVGVLSVDLCLRPRIEVGGRRLKERYAGRRHREGLVQVLGLILADGVGEGVAELVVGERNRAVAVERV